MKKRNYSIIYLAALALLLPAASSCKKSFLEIIPKGKLIARATSDYEKSLVVLDVVNIGTDAQMVMGDEVAAIEPHFSGSTLRTQRLFKWEDVIYQQGQDPIEMAVPMQNIYLFNKVINEVMASTGGTDAEKKTLVAQAKTGRAWTYFLLINYYGKPYLASTAASDPGFPIIKEADVTKNTFTRASVQEVYDFIIDDLTTAIPDLPSQITHRMRLSKAAGEAILGKVFLFMGRVNDALPRLNNAFTDMSNASIAVGLYDYNVRFGTGGSFLPIGLFGPTYPTTVNNEENILAKQASYPWGFTSNEIVLKPATLALYAADDARLNWFTGTAYPSGNYPNGLKRRRGPNTAQIGMTVPDLYLLRAETKARSNDLTGARADLEALRAKRMPAASAPIADAIASDKNALIRFILEERIREFSVMGYRWFDMRRLSVDPDFSNTISNTHTLYNADGTVASTWNLKPERLTLRFAQKTIDLNPGMPNNP
ncbi:MAG: RagB/SusD family nutrient uptake outer membrane protein [Pseudobacter sp.]|uniref:RagB/SusD family nutrient uptake outer membrane protein n=1 Tax=Pseudobacter sp. TaxID=2045420 RepID=UPI003F7E8024